MVKPAVTGLNPQRRLAIGEGLTRTRMADLELGPGGVRQDRGGLGMPN